MRSTDLTILISRSRKRALEEDLGRLRLGRLSRPIGWSRVGSPASVPNIHRNCSTAFLGLHFYHSVRSVVKRLSLILASGMVIKSAAITGAAVQKQQFEVASIKPNTSGGGRLSLDASKGRFIATNVTVRILLRYAFDPGLPNDDMLRGQALFSDASAIPITGGPGWLTSDHFDIAAKPTEGHTTSQDEMQIMVHSLLEDRFQLRVHREMREMPTYDLVVVKDGKMRPSDEKPSSPGSAQSEKKTLPQLPRGVISTFVLVKPDPGTGLVLTMYGKA
jgi:hypothetical protein